MHKKSKRHFREQKKGDCIVCCEIQRFFFRPPEVLVFVLLRLERFAMSSAT
jgi:hypothetical protein